MLREKRDEVIFPIARLLEKRRVFLSSIKFNSSLSHSLFFVVMLVVVKRRLFNEPMSEKRRKLEQKQMGKKRTDKLRAIILDANKRQEVGVIHGRR